MNKKELQDKLYDILDEVSVHSNHAGRTVIFADEFETVVDLTLKAIEDDFK